MFYFLQTQQLVLQLYPDITDVLLTTVTFVTAVPWYHRCVTDKPLLVLQLYPAHDSDKFTRLLSDLQTHVSHLSQGDSQKTSIPDHTPDGAAIDSTSRLHWLAVSMARYYHSLDTVANSYDDLNAPL